MKTLTQEWLNAARDDILTIEELIDSEHLTHIVAFHAEQAVEKCLKAILEEYDVEFPNWKTVESITEVTSNRYLIKPKRVENAFTKYLASLPD